MSLRNNMIGKPTIISLLAVLMLAITFALTSLDAYQQHNQVQQQPTVVNSSGPYWRRPGCYRVGHTRTISIPGCVKFNLSTNACRGYCMSYSIPSAIDLGPSDEVEVEPVGNEVGLTSYVPLVPKPVSSGSRISGREINIRGPRPEAVLIVPATLGPSKASRSTPSGSDQLKGQLAQAETPNSAVGDQSFTATGPIESDRREIVSVSQCCNMMETEEVVVNLRCGPYETRRLVFKSAKSCECFFCKHV